MPKIQCFVPFQKLVFFLFVDIINCFDVLIFEVSKSILFSQFFPTSLNLSYELILKITKISDEFLLPSDSFLQKRSYSIEWYILTIRMSLTLTLFALKIIANKWNFGTIWVDAHPLDSTFIPTFEILRQVDLKGIQQVRQVITILSFLHYWIYK